MAVVPAPKLTDMFDSFRYTGTALALAAKSMALPANTTSRGMRRNVKSKSILQSKLNQDVYLFLSMLKTKSGTN